MNTPALLIRAVLYVLVGQVLVIAVIAIAVPDGASLLTVAGFVTPYYEHNVLAVRIAAIPLTDPTVYVSLQSAAQMLAIALAAAGIFGLVRTNPWQHGVLPDSSPPGRDRSAGSGAAEDPAPASGPGPSPASDAGGPTPPVGLG